MKAAVALTFFLTLGCVSASPFSSTVAQSSSSSASSVSASSSSFSSSSSSSFGYYSTDVCTAVGYNIRDYLPTVIFDEIEQQFLQKKCDLLNSYGVYPRDIGPLFSDLSPESLNYDIIIVGSGPAGLSAIPTLAALGKRILVLEKGYYAPASCDSLYYRTSLYGSEYVNAYEGYVNGIDITKKIYTSNLLGGLSPLDSNAWNIGSIKLYEQLAQISDEFSWEKIYSRYQALESYKTSSTSSSSSVSVSSTTTSSTSSSSSSSSMGSSSCSSSSTTSTTTYSYSSSGSYSIYNSYRESFLSRTISSLFEELGYSNNASPFDLTPGFTILPILGDAGRPVSFPYTIFSSLSNTDNIDLALGTTVDQILFNGPRASGVQVTTPSGQNLVITANDQVILSTGPISTYKLLFNSGIGPQDLLSQFNIAPQFPIPSFGQQLIFSPVYNGLCLKFPKGFLSDYDSDLSNLAYVFGDYELSSSVALNYYRAYLAVGGSQEANVAFKFQAFSQSTSLRLRSTLNYWQFDSEAQQYCQDLLNDYDLLFFNIQLLNPRSRGSIYYRDSIDVPYIDTGLYTDDYDIQCLLEAIQQAQSIAQTKIFSSYNAELIQIPIKNYGSNYFTEEYNRQSLLYHSTTSLYSSGGFAVGKDFQTAVVDQALRIIGTENLRLFSPSVSPYPLYSDSIAFSTLIGYYGAEVISNEYNNIFLDTISISNTGISASSTNIESSSYSSRDVDVSSSSFSSTNINQNGLSGSSNSLDIDSSSYSANSVDIDSSSYSSSSTDIDSNGYSSSSTDINSSSYSSNSVDIDSSSYSSGNGIVSGGSGVISASSSEYEASNSSYESSQYSSNNISSSNSGGAIVGGASSSASNSQYSSESQSYAAESESSSSYSNVNGSSIGGAFQSSQYSASEYEASASQYESSSSSASSISGGSIIDC